MSKGQAAAAPTQEIWFWLCLVIDFADESLVNSSMCMFLTVAPPCGLGEESQESRFLAEDVMST